MNALHARRRPRPPLWRLCVIQVMVLGCALAVSAAFAPHYWISIALAGALTVIAQSFWIWRSLARFGDPHSQRYLAGTFAGIMGKWIIILVGLVLLWRSQLDLSVGATVMTVFLLNTLAALAAPISISHPRKRVDNG